MHAELRLGREILVGHGAVEMLMRRARLVGAMGRSRWKGAKPALVPNALGTAIDNRTPKSGATIHSDHGVRYGSWAFTMRAKGSGLVLTMGSIGDCYDNATMESFWSRMQVELRDRHRWPSWWPSHHGR